MIMIGGVEMVDVHEAARLAHRSPETIRRWVWSGRIRAVKQGNKYFVPRDDVAVESGEITSTPEFDPFEAWARSVLERAERLPARSGSAAALVLEDRAVRAGR